MTPQERKERSRKLAEAFETYLEGQGFDGLLGDWLVIGTVVRVDNEGDPDATYFVGFTDGTMLQHVALGLLRKAEDILLSGGAEEGD